MSVKNSWAPFCQGLFDEEPHCWHFIGDVPSHQYGQNDFMSHPVVCCHCGRHNLAMAPVSEDTDHGRYIPLRGPIDKELVQVNQGRS